MSNRHQAKCRKSKSHGALAWSNFQSKSESNGSTATNDNDGWLQQTQMKITIALPLSFFLFLSFVLISWRFLQLLLTWAQSMLCIILQRFMIKPKCYLVKGYNHLKDNGRWLSSKVQVLLFESNLLVEERTSVMALCNKCHPIFVLLYCRLIFPPSTVC